jgi:hypothetical protein
VSSLLNELDLAGVKRGNNQNVYQAWLNDGLKMIQAKYLKAHIKRFST